MRRHLGPVLGLALVLPFAAGAQSAAPVATAQEPAGSQEGPQAAEIDAESDPDEEAEAAADEEQQKSHKRKLPDFSPDALRDPIIDKFIKRRVLIDRPGFSLETRGKIQVQFYDADPDDPDNEDDLFLRRVRPFFLGHIGQSWTWKVEAELSADIEVRSIDFDQLDIRDFFLRYEGFAAPGWRLTLGNQKAPFSRDFLTPAPHLLLVERTFVGNTKGGVPERPLGVHFRGESRAGKVAYWSSLGALGHDPGADRMKFDSLVGGSGNLNEGLVLAARLDLHPRGAMTFADGDAHTPRLKYTWSLAGYVWENDGNNNLFTEGGEALDAEKEDLDSASGLEVSGGLRGRGITLDWQYNRIEGHTVCKGFSGGIYANGETRLDIAAAEGGYRLRRFPVELGGALERFDADGYAEPWEKTTLVLNLHGLERFNSKLQVSHGWISNRQGVPGEDFQETRIQLQYVW
jgi:hypothetical protein